MGLLVGREIFGGVQVLQGLLISTTPLDEVHQCGCDYYVDSRI